MVNKPKQIGTAGETGVTRAARRLGFPMADRQPLRGNQDTGDVDLCPGIIVSVKAGAAAKNASLAQIQSWWVELLGMRDRSNAQIGLLVVARRGYAPARAEHWRCFIDAGGLVAGFVEEPMHHLVRTGLDSVTVEAQLGQILTLLRLQGWGEPIEQEIPA